MNLPSSNRQRISPAAAFALVERAKPRVVMVSALVLQLLFFIINLWLESRFGSHSTLAYLLAGAVLGVRFKTQWPSLVAHALGLLLEALLLLTSGYPAQTMAVALSMFLLNIACVQWLARMVFGYYVISARASFHDGLTHLLNRRGFMARLEEEVAWQKRYGSLLTLAVIQIGDASRHSSVSDAVLKQVAETLRSRTRYTDVLGRLGSDGFGVLLRNAPADQARLTLEQIQNTLQSRLGKATPGLLPFVGFLSFDRAPESGNSALEKACAALHHAQEHKLSGVLDHSQLPAA